MAATAFTQIVATRLHAEDPLWGRRINSTGPIGKDTVAYRVGTSPHNPFSIDIVLGAGGLINDNYSCRLPRTRSAGLWTHRESCETARFPCGGRVDHGCPGAAIARETDVGEDVGGGRGGGRDERADGATLAERRVAVDGEGASDVADAGGPVRRRVGVGGRAAVGGGYGGTTAGADAVHVAVPAASGSLSGGAPAHPLRATKSLGMRD